MNVGKTTIRNNEIRNNAPVPFHETGCGEQCCGSGSESGSTCFWASWIRIRILLSLRKIARKTLISTVLSLLFDYLPLKNDVKVPSKSNMQKNGFEKINFLLPSWRSMMKIEGSRSASGSESGSISQKHWSADPHPDPDPHQNVMDPQHWWGGSKKTSLRAGSEEEPAQRWFPWLSKKAQHLFYIGARWWRRKQ